MKSTYFVYDVYNKIQFIADIPCAEDTPNARKLRHAVQWAINNNVSLQCANLQGADLRNMDLSNVSLKGANLTNADLSGAFVKTAGAIFDDINPND